jgi:hypothetical protein
MIPAVSNADAVHRYPELQELIAVREAGWVFRPIQDIGGPMEGIAGSFSPAVHGCHLHLRPDERQCRPCAR